MLISGNQTAVEEMVALLDPGFPAKRMCHHCNSSFGQQIDAQTHENIYGKTYHIFEIEYDGTRISKCKDMNGAHYASDGSNNLFNGCVK